MEKYLEELKEGGKSSYGVTAIYRAIRGFLARCRPMPPEEITAEVMADVSVIMEADNLTENYRRTAMIHTGRFIESITGVNPYNGIDPDSKEKWFEGHMGEFRFQHQLEQYEQYMRDKKLSNNSIRKKKIHIVTCCRVLTKEKHILFVSQIDESCYWHLDDLMKGVNTVTVGTILFDLDEFVKWCCGGKSIIKKYRRRRDPYREYQKTQEYADFMELVKSYKEDMEERDLRPKTIQSTTYMIKEGYGLICESFGAIDPGKIDHHHLRAIRNNITGLKQRTVHLYLCHLGKMLAFFFGVNPYANAGLKWSKENVERTWIFREEWDTLWNMADEQEKVVLALGGGMGLRLSEIANLKIEDIGEKMIIKGKGSGPEGKIDDKPIPQTVRMVIEEYRKGVRASLTSETDPVQGNLLVMDKQRVGAPSTERHVETIIHRLSDRSGIDFSSHTLRRYYCMTLIDAGVELDVVRRMMRHEDVQTTMNHYIMADPRKMAKATNIVETAIFG